MRVKVHVKMQRELRGKAHHVDANLTSWTDPNQKEDEPVSSIINFKFKPYMVIDRYMESIDLLHTGFDTARRRSSVSSLHHVLEN